MGLTLVTGGAGYVGSAVVDELADSGRRVRVLDVLLHDQEDVARDLERRGIELVRGDVRDADARRRALDGADSVIHLAAIVGDPACKRDPELSQDVNVDASRALIADAVDAGIARLIFASTCSNYGRTADPTVPITETGELAPVSLYAEQKVSIERMLLDGSATNGLGATCLRLATVYGVSRRMRFDLTVNEFSRDLWADRELDVFGERSWRAYIHVRDVGRAMRTVLDRPRETVAGEVFNTGSTQENYRKLDLVELIRARVPTGVVKFVTTNTDPRDYQVNCDKITASLGFRPRTSVPDGIDEVLDSLSAGAFSDPFDSRYRNIP